jgi:hypothetical protein
VASQYIDLIIKFCSYHNFIAPPEITRPLQYNNLNNCVQDPWDANFISSLDFDKVTDLLLASETIKCASLMDLCYARLALYFRGN